VATPGLAGVFVAHSATLDGWERLAAPPFKVGHFFTARK
jgi:hypothetical protein